MTIRTDLSVILRNAENWEPAVREQAMTMVAEITRLREEVELLKASDAKAGAAVALEAAQQIVDLKSKVSVLLEEICERVEASRKLVEVEPCSTNTKNELPAGP